MKAFAQLFAELDATTSTTAKVEAIQRYLAVVPARDAAWAVYLLAGGKPRQVVRPATLRALACELAGLEDWLFEECYQAVGDLAETIALVLPAGDAASDGDHAGLADWMEQRLLPLRGQQEDAVRTALRGYWALLDTPGRFLLTKLVGGGFRVGVSRLLVQRAVAAHAGLDARLVAQRMMGYTDSKALPDATKFIAVCAPSTGAAGTLDNQGQPYPFFLAHALDVPAGELPARLGPLSGWQVEWKFDGIRGQVVRRAGQCWIWSRGEELVTERFPEIVAQAQTLPDGCVLDGEILVLRGGQPAPFALLQQRIGRKTLTRKVLADAPAGFIAYDLLEAGGADLRALPLHARRARLEGLLAGSALAASPLVECPDWQALTALRGESRQRGMEGFMLKQRSAPYGTGRTRQDGLWWKWKIEPMTIDCVLVYAQAGHGRRASLYTDYTFAVWSHPHGEGPEPPTLVPFAKAYSGLSDAEFREVDAIIRKTTVEKFGPVRSVQPSLVFELGFEGINASPRHKSGIAVRFPRMLRIRRDKPLQEANSLQDLRNLLAVSMGAHEA